MTEPEVLQVYVYGRSAESSEPDPSPYCVKLETFLRAAKIKYNLVPFGEHQFKDSPKHKCPYVFRSDVNSGKHLGDTAVIMKALVEKGDAPDFDSWLSAEDKLVATAFTALLEDNIYWYTLWVKWSTDQFWKYTYEMYFEAAPWAIRPVIGYFARNGVMEQAVKQGTGRHSEKELIEFASEKLATVSAFLGDKKYLMGNQLSSIDFTAFGHLSCLAAEPYEHPIVDLVRKDQRLSAYIQRMKGELFPDIVEAAKDLKSKKS